MLPLNHMFEQTDFAFDVYRPLVRFAFSAWAFLRRVLALSGTDRLFLFLRRTLLAAPAVRAASLHVADVKANAPINVDATLETIVGPGGCPGMAAVALRGDCIVAQGVAGLRKRGGPEPIRLGDRFHLGSCGKAMTATLAALLIEEGKLNWATTLAEIFGDAVKNMHPAWKNVTLHQILAHRAGLPRDTSRALRARLKSSSLTLPEQRLENVSLILSRPPKYRPGVKLVYSNVGYMLIGAAAERIAGIAWEDLIRERLFRPLGITTAGFGAPGAAGGAGQPWGHFPVIGAPVDPGSHSAELGLFDAPAGLIHMSISDWAKFVALHLRGDAANPCRRNSLLKPETMSRLHPLGLGDEYSSGWIFDVKEWAKGAQPGASGRILFHSGSNFRWYCIVWMAPEIDFAVLTACNRGMDFRAWKICENAAGTLIQSFAPKSSLML